jgi:transcriptional regulator with XRE-family HTH domain
MPQKPNENLTPLNLSNETLGQRIAHIRKKRGLTQKELAEKIGITRSRLSNYEIDRIHLYDELLIRFALALDVSLDYLTGLKDKPDPLPKK